MATQFLGWEVERECALLTALVIQSSRHIYCAHDTFHPQNSQVRRNYRSGSEVHSDGPSVVLSAEGLWAFCFSLRASVVLYTGHISRIHFKVVTSYKAP